MEGEASTVQDTTVEKYQDQEEASSSQGLPELARNLGQRSSRGECGRGRGQGNWSQGEGLDDGQGVRTGCGLDGAKVG